MIKNNCVFVIVGFNNLKMTDKLIRNFRQHLSSYQLWLYDNGSTPSLQKLADKYKLPYLRSEENLGFSGGGNKIVEWVLKKSRVEVVCLLNNDLLFNQAFGKRVSQSLLEFIRDEKSALMSPLLFSNSQLTQVENFGVFYYQSGLAFQNRTNKVYDNILINGACLFMKTTVCRKLLKDDGFVFQPYFFFYAEDVELSLRLLSRGYTIFLNKELAVSHLGQKSLGKLSERGLYFSWRNLLFVFFISRLRRELFHDLLFFIIGQLTLILYSWKLGYFRLFFLVYSSFLKNIKLTLNARKQFLKLRTIDTINEIKSGIFPLRNN